MLRITQIVASIDTEAAGPSYTVPRLAQSLADLDETDVALATLGRPSTVIEAGVTHNRFARDLTWAGPLARLGSSRSMRKMLLCEPRDILHTHGLWMMPNVYPAEASRNAGSRFLLSPRGMLGSEAMKFSRVLKWMFWLVQQKKALSEVSCYHATSAQEYEDIRAFGLMKPVAVIPNGIDLPNLADFSNNKTSNTRVLPEPEKPFVLSLGRIHPKKGLDQLIRAFSIIAHEYPEWRLRIVGPDERGHARTLKRLVSACGLDGCVSIELPVYGVQKLRLMRQAELFILSTLHENFGMTVSESLAVETPVISTKGAPWADLETYGCGWWIDHGHEAIAAALKVAMTMPASERRLMGARGRNWMDRDYGWNSIGRQMASVYAWLRDARARPDCIWT